MFCSDFDCAEFFKRIVKVLSSGKLDELLELFPFHYLTPEDPKPLEPRVVGVSFVTVCGSGL